MISIVNYGIGNVGSVANMFRHVGVEAELASDVEGLERARALLLPGVGHFGQGMLLLEQRGFLEPLRRKVLVDRIPILGICLGMQLLGRGSEEAVGVPGLGFIDADFLKFRVTPGSPLKVPHMGWNTVSPQRPNPLLGETAGEGEQRFYFVHSYYARCNDASEIVATSSYGNEFVCAYGRDNIWGVQFHPEKSHKFGMNLLKNFAALAC